MDIKINISGNEMRTSTSKTFVVYILQSLKDRGYYVGHTSNIERRLSEHNSGKTKSLKHRIPFAIIYTEKFRTRKEAKIRERQIKSYKGGEAFLKLIGSPGPRRG